MNLLDKFESKYIIKGKLKALAPLHIGTGITEFSPIAVDNSIIRDENNNPFIPGSSLKGVLRCFIERLLHSGIFSEYTSCIITDKPCVDNNKIKEIKYRFKNSPNAMKEISMELYSAQCDVCKVFGGKSFASKLKIADAKLIGNKASILQRNGVIIDRDTLTAAYGLNYNFETVVAGTEFYFEMTIDNLDKEHEMLLKIIINQLKSENLTVGGKISAGLGTIVLEDEEIYLINRNNMKEYFFSGITEKNKNLFMEESL